MKIHLRWEQLSETSHIIFYWPFKEITPALHSFWLFHARNICSVLHFETFLKIIVTKKCPLFFNIKYVQCRMRYKGNKNWFDFYVILKCFVINTVGNLHKLIHGGIFTFDKSLEMKVQMSSVNTDVWINFSKIFSGQNCKLSLCDISHHKASLLNQLKPRNETL